MDMQKVNPNKKKKPWMPWAIGAACILCFGAGLLIPAFSHTGPSAGANAETNKFMEAYDLLKDNWYYAKDSENIDERLIEQAISGMASLEEDRHTNYFNLEQAQAFSQSLAGSNVGIGVSFTQGENGQMVVRQVFINSTADRAGLQPGDEIIKIGDKETNSLSTDDLVAYIKSFENKPLEITFTRNGEEQSVTVTPGVFDSTVSAQMVDGAGLITLSSFSENSGKDFTDAIGRVQKEGAKDLILDLRNNTGGYLSAACQIASSFLPNNTVIFQENLKDGKVKQVMTDNAYAQIEFDHIYILQNGNTASASEVLIGALKDHMPDKVTTIGTNTYGKGTEQVTVPFDDGTSLKYTMAEWTTPNGTSINKTGFAPDVEVTEDEVQSVTYVMPGEGESLSIAPDSVHPNAAAVQVYLRALGYPAERSDSYFAPASSEALKAFQSDNGLEPTGIVDNATFEKLTEALGRKLAASSQESDAYLQSALRIIRGEEAAPAAEPAEAASEEHSETPSEESAEHSEGE